MDFYKEIAKLNIAQPEAFLVERRFLGGTECNIMIQDFSWDEKTEGVHPYGFRKPTESEMKNISEQMKNLGAYSF